MTEGFASVAAVRGRDINGCEQGTPEATNGQGTTLAMLATVFTLNGQGTTLVMLATVFTLVIPTRERSEAGGICF